MVARFITSNLNRIRKTYSVSTTFSRHNYDFTSLYSSPYLQLDDDDSARRVVNPSFMLQKRWHTGDSHSHHHDHHDLRSGKGGERIFRLGLAADIGLAASKAFAGYVCGSTAIIADAAHSISDVVLSGVSLLSFQAARVPKDKEHPYGHGKFETLGALGISGVLLATAGGIGWHALDVLLGLWSAAPEVFNLSMTHQHVHEQHHHGIDMDHPILALSVTILSIGVKEGLYWITKQEGEKVGSGLMKANAWHHRADAVSSFVALIGVGGSILGVRILDPLAGLAVAGMIMKAGLETGYQSVLELVDAAIPSHILEPFKRTILQVDGVEGCSHLRGRRAKGIEGLDIGVLINNVGVTYPRAMFFHEVDENIWKNIVKVNLEGTTLVTMAVLPSMIGRKKGAIVNIGSGASIVVPSHPLFSIYAATKAYIDQFSRCLYDEYKHHGIDVQCQVPLYVKTKMTSRVASIEKSSLFSPTPEKYAKAGVAQIGYGWRSMPYWPHSIQWWFASLLPQSLLDAWRLSIGLNRRIKT